MGVFFSKSEDHKVIQLALARWSVYGITVSHSSESSFISYVFSRLKPNRMRLFLNRYPRRKRRNYQAVLNVEVFGYFILE